MQVGKNIPGILGDIIEYKYEFVAECKKRIPPKDMEARALDTAPGRGFAEALKRGGCSLIAEIKTASPSRGLIRNDIDITDVARLYEANGAACISVLTDERFFRGSVDRLAAIRNTVSLPLLRKDFIIDSYQLYEARCNGASAALLIAACLDNAELEDFIEIAGLLGLDTLVEVHNEDEMVRIAHLNTSLIGINNRDLTTFVTDIAVTGALAPKAPGHALIVSESGIFTSDDVRKVHACGAHAVLVGEAIMRERDMAGKVRELAGAVA